MGSLNGSKSNTGGLLTKNKLSSKLSKGINKLVSKIKKRESYYCDLQRSEDPMGGVNPPPRESAVLVSCSHNHSFLLGGLNYEVVKEIA